MLAKPFFLSAVLLAVVATSALAQQGPKERGSKCGVFEWIGFTDPAFGTVDGTVGFAGMHAECKAEFGPATRFGTAREYFLTVGHDTPAVDAWVHPIRSFSLFPGPVQHCLFWLAENPEFSLGAVITPAGQLNQVLCNVQRPVTCSAPAC